MLGFAGASAFQIEERLIIDDAFFQEVLIEEEELSQDYVDGHLSVSEKTAFEKHFLISSERKENVKFSQLLRNRIDALDEVVELHQDSKNKLNTRVHTNFSGGFTSRFGMRMLFASLALFLFVGFIGVLVFNSGNIKLNPLEQEYAELNQSNLVDLSKFGKFTEVNLIPGAIRGAQDESEISSANFTNKTLLRLGFPSKLASDMTFRIELKKDNTVIFTQPEIAVSSNGQGGELRFFLPSTVLKSGEYQVVVQGNADASLKFIYQLPIN